METLGQAIVSGINWADENRLQFLMGIMLAAAVVFCIWAYRENCEYNGRYPEDDYEEYL